MKVVVRRSAVRMWLLAMGGVPLLVISLDVLTNRRITNWLRDLIFTPQNTQIYEPRDVIWAWLMALFGALLVLWGLKELFWPTRVIESTKEGVVLSVGGPRRKPVLVPWEEIAEIRAGEVVDEGQRLPVLIMETTNPVRIGDDPWGARWRGPGELALLVEDWAEPAEVVARQLGEARSAAQAVRLRGHSEPQSAPETT